MVCSRKIAQQLSDLSLTSASDLERKLQAKQALAYAERAVKLAPDNAVNVLSLAICYGKMGVYSDVRTKIEYSRKVREAALRAITLDPEYDWAHHVLGRWHYEVASLGAATRFFVRLIYGGLPEASKEEAVRQLEKAVALAPDRVPHHLELAFAYLALGREADAKASFDRGLALPSKELYDESAKTRARAARAALAG
jgi:tetratricopeptide (TPR) repeat protein